MESVEYYIVSRVPSDSRHSEYVICETGNKELAEKYYCNRKSYISDGVGWSTKMKVIKLGELPAEAADIIRKQVGYVDLNYTIISPNY